MSMELQSISPLLLKLGEKICALAIWVKAGSARESKRTIISQSPQYSRCSTKANNQGTNRTEKHEVRFGCKMNSIELHI